MMALMTLAAAGCGGQEAGSSASTEGSGGSGGSSAQGNTTSAASNSAVASNAVAASNGAGGGMAFVCDPPAAPGSIFERSAVSYDINAIDPVSMCKYRGDVMLIVDTAAL
jgi:hypothetical protein